MPGNSGSSPSLTDAIGIGTLTRLVPRELVDEVVASAGRTEIRRNKLPARVMVYFVMACATRRELFRVEVKDRHRRVVAAA
jgi:hypothetical protein